MKKSLIYLGISVFVFIFGQIYEYFFTWSIFKLYDVCIFDTFYRTFYTKPFK